MLNSLIRPKINSNYQYYNVQPRMTAYIAICIIYSYLGNYTYNIIPIPDLTMQKNTVL